MTTESDKQTENYPENVQQSKRKDSPQPKWTPRITIAGVLGIFMGFTPLVGNAILRKAAYTSAYATDDTAALQHIGLVSASIFAATRITFAPALWGSYDNPYSGLGPRFKAFCISPFGYLGSGVITSAISWGIFRSAGCAGTVTLKNVISASAVGCSVVGGGLWVVLFYYAAQMMKP